MTKPSAFGTGPDKPVKAGSLFAAPCRYLSPQESRAIVLQPDFPFGNLQTPKGWKRHEFYCH
jgi:hypothetical protein